MPDEVIEPTLSELPSLSTSPAAVYGQDATGFVAGAEAFRRAQEVLQGEARERKQRARTQSPARGENLAILEVQGALREPSPPQLSAQGGQMHPPFVFGAGQAGEQAAQAAAAAHAAALAGPRRAQQAASAAVASCAGQQDGWAELTK